MGSNGSNTRNHVPAAAHLFERSKCVNCGCSKRSYSKHRQPCLSKENANAAAALPVLSHGVTAPAMVAPLARADATRSAPEASTPEYVLAFSPDAHECRVLHCVPGKPPAEVPAEVVESYRSRRWLGDQVDPSSRVALDIVSGINNTAAGEATDSRVTQFLRAIESRYTRHFIHRTDGSLWPFIDDPCYWGLQRGAGGEFRLCVQERDGTPIPIDRYVHSRGQEPSILISDTYIRFGPPMDGTVVPGTRCSPEWLASYDGIRLMRSLRIPPPKPIAQLAAEKLEVLTVEIWTEGDYLVCRPFIEWHYDSEGGRDIFAGHVETAEPGTYLEKHPDLLAAGNYTAALLFKRGFTWYPPARAWTHRKRQDYTLSLFALLDALPQTARIRLSDELQGIKRYAVTGVPRFSVTRTGVDWFELRTIIKLRDSDLVLTEAEVKILLAAREQEVALDDNRVVSLRASGLDNVGATGFSFDELSGRPTLFHTIQLKHLVDESEAAHADLLDPEVQEQIRQRLREMEAGVKPEVPEELVAALRNYQIEGFEFLVSRLSYGFGPLLADDMGLGKTIQTLAAWKWLHKGVENPGPTLVICPKSVVANWVNEGRRFLPGLRIAALAGRSVDTVVAQNDILVCNYSEVRMRDTMAKIDWFMVVADEAQNIKNPGRFTSRALCALKAQHRVSLTGTPIENRLTDLWSILHFSAPRILGRLASFRRRFRDDDGTAARRLADRVRPFLLRRTKSEVEIDLPPKTEEDLVISLSPHQREIYQAELKLAQARLLQIKTQAELDKQRFHILPSLLRLRQICCHPQLVNESLAEAGSAKLSILLERVEQIVSEGNKVLVFSSFTQMLDLIETRCCARQWNTFKLTGETQQRQNVIESFDAVDGGAVFLVSLKAGGAGINLTSASYVILYDPWWNMAAEMQAMDRAHRIGQTKPVIVYRLLAENTIEAKIRNLQAHKEYLSASVIDEATVASALTLKDFEYIFSEAAADQRGADSEAA